MVPELQKAAATLTHSGATLVNATPSHYVHGTDPEEQHRLARLNDLLNRGSIRELALRPGERVLDLGCGLGQLTRSMAEAVGPQGRVVGIDRSPEQLREARKLAHEMGPDARIEFREGDVLDLALPEPEWGAFDVAHTRFVLEHVPRPLDVVRSMVRAVRPGGRIVLEDEDHEILRLWPAPEGFERVWNAYIESYVRNGNDPRIGRKLTTLLHQAGAAPRRGAAIWFGCSAGEPMFPTWVENLAVVLIGARESVLAGGAISNAEFDATLGAVRAWGQLPDAAAWYFMAFAEGLKPE